MATRTILATVAATAPVRLQLDLDTTDTQVPAINTIGTLHVGDRVRVELQTPLPPVITGLASS